MLQQVAQLYSTCPHLVVEQSVNPDHVLPLSHGSIGSQVDLRPAVQRETDDLPRRARRLPRQIDVSHLCPI